MRVLIDTWWNVNKIIRIFKNGNLTCFNRYMVECESVTNFTVGRVYLVLIDTWWNVNYSVESVFASGLLSFNRYMVECELLLWKSLHTWMVVLIDTWWNVNTIKSVVSCRTKNVLIDTWWNVNQEFVDSLLRLSGFNRYMVECESRIC